MPFTVPTIDLKQPRPSLVEALRTVFLTHGFFQIKAHDVSPMLQTSLLSKMREFFSLPAAIKNSPALQKTDPMGGGYEVWRTYKLDKEHNDLNEGFMIASDQFPTSWPTMVDDMKETCLEYCKSVHALALELGSLVAEGLGIERNGLDALFDDMLCLLRLIHYHRPAAVEAREQDQGNFGTKPHPEREIGGGLHADWTVITIVLQDMVGGLQFFDPDTNEFVDVQPMPGYFVVNAGEMLNRLTNGVYRAGLHRVIEKDVEHRYSAPFFFYGKGEYEMDVLPVSEEWKKWAEENGHPFPEDRQFETERVVDFLQERFRAGLEPPIIRSQA